MGDARSGEGVGGSTDFVADGAKRNPDSLHGSRPRVALRFTRATNLRMAARMKFPLAEWPEHGYTAKIALMDVLPLTSGDRAV